MARKLTALQHWRRNYAEIVFTIRSAKAVARGKGAGHIWGDFKRPQAQRLAASMRRAARHAMEIRPFAVDETREQWERDSIKRAEKLGHPIPNTTDPKDKV